MRTIDRVLREAYGLQLHTDHPAWPLMPRHAVTASAYAAGFLTALSMADRDLAADLVAVTGGDTVTRSLARTRDHAWHVITEVAVTAYRLGCTSLPTGANTTAEPALVRVGLLIDAVYPTLRDPAHPGSAYRFTPMTAQRISADLTAGCDRHGYALRAHGAGYLLSRQAPTRLTVLYQPDSDGLLAVGADYLDWQPARTRPDRQVTR